MQPDLVVVCDRSKIDRRGIVGAPDFVLEVLSPSSQTHDHRLKLNLYEQFGVIIDATHRVLFSHTRNGDLFAAAQIYEFDTLLPVNSVAGLRIDLVQLARVLDRAERLIRP